MIFSPELRRFSVVRGTGSYLPKKILTNDDLAKMVDTNDEWITERTGIKKRHIVAEGEYTADMAAIAGKKAMAAAGVSSSQIDLVVVATTTPENTFPSTATQTQSLLHITQGAALDVNAVCAGFIYALIVADNAIRCGQAKHVLVIGADVLSRIVDWRDRSTCILFGDGAGAVILSASDALSIEQSEHNGLSRGLLASDWQADGRYRDLLYVDGGVGSTGEAGVIHMQGREVFKHAVQKMTESTLTSLEKAGLKKEAIDWAIPHQANRRILEATARRLELPSQRMVCTVADHGNTSAASIPLALDVTVRDGRVQAGHILALQAIGGGLTWGSAIIRW